MLVRGRTLVKGKQFAGDRSIGHCLQAAQIHARRGVDELCILDIGATAEGRGPDLDLVRELSEGCFVPITVGGGIRMLDDIDKLLRAGADKVCIGSAAIESRGMPECRAVYGMPFIERASNRFGSQAIVVSLDVKEPKSGSLLTEINGVERRLSPALLAQTCKSFGAGEILLQSVDRDGMMTGYDLDTIRAVTQAVDIPVIASGGCGTPEHMHEALAAGADAVAAGAMFAFTDETPRSCARYLKQQGWEVRL
jgi:cyclase